MEFCVFNNYDEMSIKAADLVTSQLKNKNNSVLGFASGSSPIGLYNELVNRYKSVKKIGLWLYITGKKKFYNDENEVDIMIFDSIMFLNKLVEWASKVISYGYEPVIRINYYNND